MKDELNSYGIINSDGVSQSFVNEGKVSFDNDRTDYISEWEKSAQGEMVSVPETYDDRKVVHEEESEDGNTNIDTSSASQAASASSTASATSASIGGGVGALAGAVAAGVAAAVVVVVAFLSTLAMSLSLVTADMHTLIFKLTMTGADERDFEQPVYAVLTSGDTYLEQEVKADTVLLTFDDLEPGKEYFLTVKNEEKVFAEVSAFTATEPNDKGDIVSRMQGTDVFVTVQKADLKADEYYTLIAEDAQGNVVFSKDGVDAFVEYTFTVDEPKDLYFYLMVKGKTYAVSQILLPDYDFAGGVWTWNDDFTAATVTFTDTKGGENLILDATVTRKKIEPTCEEDGNVVYTAEATYQGKSYTDKKSFILESTGHEYEGVLGEDGRITYTCSRCGDTYTD